MSNRSVSVLVPIFGNAPYLSQALDSVSLEVHSARQVGIEVESVLVLDRASAATQDQVSVFASGNSDVLVVESSSPGLTNALNLGLNCVSSTYVARFDSDDVMLPGRLATQVNDFEANSDLVLVGGQISRWSRNQVVSTSALPLDHDDIVRKLLRGRHAISHSSCMFRTEAIRSLSGYRNLVHAEDWDLYLRLARVGQITNCAQVVTMYRFHALSVTGRDAYLTQHGMQRAIAIHSRDAHGANHSNTQIPHHLPLWIRIRAHRRAKAQIMYRRAMNAECAPARVTLYLIAGIYDFGAGVNRIRQRLISMVASRKSSDLSRGRDEDTIMERSA